MDTNESVAVIYLFEGGNGKCFELCATELNRTFHLNLNIDFFVSIYALQKVNLDVKLIQCNVSIMGNIYGMHDLSNMKGQDTMTVRYLGLQKL